MKKFFAACCIVIAIGISACNNNSNKDNIIEKNKFVNVLTDIHMADATLVIKGFRINADSVRVRKYYNDVLLEYNVTQKQIHNTFLYYTENPREFEKLYEQVSANIVKLEKEHEEKNNKEELKEEFKEEPNSKKSALRKRN